MDFSEIKVGDRILISRPSTDDRFACTIGPVTTVTAVRLTSFDAGGFCFRKDGTELGGRSRACLFPPTDAPTNVSPSADPAAGNGNATGPDTPEWPGEDVILALSLSYRSQSEWLNLGLAELRRIAALFHLPPAEKTETAPTPDFAHRH